MASEDAMRWMRGRDTLFKTARTDGIGGTMTPALRKRLATFAVAVTLAVTGPATAWGVSPSPELLAKAKHDPAASARVAAARKAEASGRIDAPSVDRIIVTKNALGAPSVRVMRTPAAQGQLKSLAILVQFPDRLAQTPASYFDSLLFGDGWGPASLRGFYKEISYGKLLFSTADMPSSTGWVTLPHNAAYYAGTNNGMGSYPNNAAKMVEDALPLIDAAGVDFSAYDNDHDDAHTVDNLIVIHAGEGAEGGTDATGTIWSHKTQLPVPLTLDGVTIDSFSTEPEFATTAGKPASQTVGIFAHEVGHILGLRDLYDTLNEGPSGIGEWSLMSSGNWLGPDGAAGSSPSRLDAWSASELGWLTPTVIASAPEVRELPAVEASESGTAYRIDARGSGGSEYFLVENRQRIGTDSYLPGAGALVWHIDTGVWSDNDDPAHKLVALEEADGRRDLDEGWYNRGDASDPFPGTSDNRAFSWGTVPNSKTYGHRDSGVYLDRISDSGPTMTARMGLAPSNPTSVTYGVMPGCTRIAWTPTADALGYRVSVGSGSLFVPGATASSISVNGLVGPKTKVTVAASGANDIPSASARASYKTVEAAQLGAVRFRRGSSALSDSAKSALRSYARSIAAQGFTKLTVRGHTSFDGRSTRSSRQALSVRRAKVVRTYLLSRLSRLHAKVSVGTVGYGSTKPVASNATASGQAKNRRAELILK